MTTAAVIVAAGRGSRAGGEVPKQWQMLAGRPVLAHAINAFRAQTDRIVVVIHPDDRARAEAVAAGCDLVPGGATRDASVRNALEALAGAGVERVLIHDGARPLVSPAVIGRVLAALETHAGAAPALPPAVALTRHPGAPISRGAAPPPASAGISPAAPLHGRCSARPGQPVLASQGPALPGMRVAPAGDDTETCSNASSAPSSAPRTTAR